MWEEHLLVFEQVPRAEVEGFAVVRSHVHCTICAIPRVAHLANLCRYLLGGRANRLRGEGNSGRTGMTCYHDEVLEPGEGPQVLDGRQ